MKFIYQDSARLSQDEINKTASQLTDYAKHLKQVVTSGNYEAAESSINLPSDEDVLKQSQEMKKQKVTDKLKYVIDIGIGGSNLGTKAIYDAFFGYYDMLEDHRENNAKMIFVDTNEEGFLAKLCKFIEKLNDKEEVLINAISKSGGTTETIANLEIVMAAMERRFPGSKDRLVITTDENSPLWKKAQELGISVLPLAKQVGGRFSVFSNVGIFPLMAIGIHVEAIRHAATTIRDICLNEDPSQNPAMQSAAILYLHYKNGKNINDNFFFTPQLESIGKWYRQLMGESVGKEHDLQGNPAHTGITPTVSLGSTDLHSVGQLYLGGPKDKITTFISSAKPKYEARVPVQLQFPLVEHINGKRASDLMNAIKDGVKIAYQNQEQPFTELILEEINETGLAEFMQFKMCEMMYLGKLMNVNTFDQPHVELYKVETKKILQSQ